MCINTNQDDTAFLDLLLLFLKQLNATFWHIHNMIYLQLHRKPLRTSRREPASWHSGTASGWNPPPLTPWFPHAFCETRQRSRFGNRTWHWRRKILREGGKKKSMLITDTRRQTNSKSEMRSKKTPNNKLTQLNVRVRGLFLLLLHQVCVTCKKHCKLNNGHKVNNQYLFFIFCNQWRRWRRTERISVHAAATQLGGHLLTGPGRAALGPTLSNAEQPRTWSHLRHV